MEAKARPIVFDDGARVLLRFNSGHIPGDPIQRDKTLLDAFFEQIVGRRYLEATDYAHLPATITLPNCKCWVVIDISFSRRTTLNTVPIFCYRVVPNHLEESSLGFRRVNFIGARQQSNIFPWGHYYGSDKQKDEKQPENNGIEEPEQTDTAHTDHPTADEIETEQGGESEQTKNAHTDHPTTDEIETEQGGDPEQTKNAHT
ncbi:hypothetical protein AJ78_07926, partial [Emergomyces pasteurianus Ep9510]